MRVNNSALTVNGKSVNIDLTYLEKAIEEVELTPGPQGVPGSAATITGATAAIGTNEGDTPTVTVNSTGTDMARGFNFVFDNLKGKKGDDGAAAVFTAVTATVSNNSGTPKVTVVSAGTSTVGLEFKFSGLKGEQGPQGEKGADGTSINILGSFDSEDGLNDITNPKNGDAYIINGYLYVWNGTKWENVGQIKGPQGENGVTPVFSSATATITNTTGTPQVTVTSASTGSVYSLNFAFSGLKGADGKDGNTPVFTAVTANVTNTSGTPEVNVTSAATGSEYSLKFDFSGLKGEKGEPGGSGASGERGYSYFSTIFDSLSSESTAITKSSVNNSGDVRTNDYIVSKEGEVFLVTSTTGIQFKLSYVSSFRGPQGATGTFDSSELNNYVQKGNTDYKNYNAISNIYTKYYDSNGVITSAGTYSAVTYQDTIGIEGKGGIRTDITPITGIITIDATSAITSALSVVEKNYVQTGNTDYLNANAFGFIVCYDNVLDANTTISAMTASDMIYLIGTNGIKLSGFTSPGYKQLKIEAPKMVFKTAEDSYATDYPLLGEVGYNIVLEKFLTLETGLYNSLGGGYSNVFLNVKTGTTADSVAVGNHNHDDVYVTQEYFDDYDFGTTVSQSTGSSIYYLLGVASKTANTVTKAYVSSTDIYMQGGEIYAASDETLKNFGENIEVDFDKLAEIPKVYYTWKTDADNKQQIGTSAQKLREIYPELVSESEDGKLAVSYEKLSVIALSAVDKLHKENEELKERLRKIEEKLGI